VRSIEAYGREHGQFPAMLEELNPPTWPSQYGWWGYRFDASAQCYDVWHGNYVLDGHSLYFESERAEWQVNS
jgi:hypothetical protein